MDVLHFIGICMYSSVIYYMTEAFQSLQVKINFTLAKEEMVVSQPLEYNSKVFFMFFNRTWKYKDIIQVDMDELTNAVRYDHQWISDKVCSTPSSSAIPFPFQSPSYFHHISNTPPFVPVPPCLILHPYVPCFIDICFHVTMILSSLAYSFLTPFLSFLVSH